MERPAGGGSVSLAYERIGNSSRPRRATYGSVAGGVGTIVQTAGFWFGGRTASRNPREQGAGFYCVSGYSPRSAGIGWPCSNYGDAGAPGHVDSSATRALGGSFDPASRGLNWHVGAVRDSTASAEPEVRSRPKTGSNEPGTIPERGAASHPFGRSAKAMPVAASAGSAHRATCFRSV